MLAFLWILTAEIAPKREEELAVSIVYLGIAEMAHILTIFYVYRNHFDGGKQKNIRSP